MGILWRGQCAKSSGTALRREAAGGVRILQEQVLTKGSAPGCDFNVLNWASSSTAEIGGIGFSLVFGYVSRITKIRESVQKLEE